MHTDFTPHSPQAGYTATIEITGTREELSALYDLLNQAEPSDADGQRIKDDVLDELRSAHSWITDMEDIARPQSSNHKQKHQTNMKKTTGKPTKKEVAAMLSEALQPFCYEDAVNWAQGFQKPFRQHDCICASDGHVLIRIRAKEAGAAIGQFPKVDKPDVESVIPAIDFGHDLNARIISRKDMVALVEQMKQHEAEKKQVAVADVGGIRLIIDGLSRMERAMAFCGAEQARLVWHEDNKVVIELTNERDQEAVTILQMNCNPKDFLAFTLSTTEATDDADTRICWQRGMEAWREAKEKLAREEEAERMARREVYMVEMVKRAYVPVYAKNAEEARYLCDKHCGEPEKDWEAEWELGDTVPEAEDAEDVSENYKTCITCEGEVSFDRIFEMEQVSEQWHQQQESDNQ